MITATVLKHYDQADGERARQMANAQTIEQLERSQADEERWYNRRFWRILAITVLSLAACAGNEYLNEKFDWREPAWVLVFLLVPILAMMALLAGSDAQLSAKRTYELAKRIRSDLDRNAGPTAPEGQ